MKEDSTATRQHTAQVLLRFNPEQLSLIDEAAEQAGLNRTAWLRALAIREARRELGELEGAGAKGRGKFPSP